LLSNAGDQRDQSNLIPSHTKPNPKTNLGTTISKALCAP